MVDTREVVGYDALPPLGALLRETYSGIPELIRGLPRSVKAHGIVVLMGFIGNAVVSPFWVVYVIEEIGLSSLDWGLIVMLETILKTLFTFPAGVLVDRYGRTKNLLASLILSLLSMPLVVFAEGFYQVLLIRLAVAVAGALFTPASTALMADYVPSEMRGRVMAALGRGSMMVGAAGGGTGGPGMGYLFTLPVMAASIFGGFLYALNPTYTWYFILVTTVMQVFALVLFIRDPEEAH
jgi:MFS family permease